MAFCSDCAGRAWKKRKEQYHLTHMVAAQNKERIKVDEKVQSMKNVLDWCEDDATDSI